jgi:PE-PPE domain
MRGVIRSLWMMAPALIGTVALVIAWTTATAVQLAATALIMGGTFHPLSSPPDDPDLYVEPYLRHAVVEMINPAAATPTGTGGVPIGSVGETDDVYAVVTPEQFFPVFGSMQFDESVRVGAENLESCIRQTGCVWNKVLDDPPSPTAPPGAGDEFDEFVAFGYSGSAVVASLVKRESIADPQESGSTSFFLLANPMRPNGGILKRGPEGLTIPIIGVTFYGATPTNSCETGTCMPTVDAAAQYDGLGGDAPASLTNILAILNAAAGYYYLHGELQNATFDDARYQGSYGDTDYYLYPTERLPLLMPLRGIVPSPILTLLDAPLRAAIEGAYRRDVNPGIPTAAGLLPFLNPIQAILNIIVAIPTGIDDALAEAAGDPTFRPLGTTPVTSPFGVGGPELPTTPTASELRSNPVGDRDEARVEALVVDEADEPEPDSVDSTGDENRPENPPAGNEIVDDDVNDGDDDVDEGDHPVPPTSDAPLAVDRQQPTVRGPIEFDSQKPIETPPAGQPGITQTTTDAKPDPGADVEGTDDPEGAQNEAAA